MKHINILACASFFSSCAVVCFALTPQPEVSQKADRTTSEIRSLKPEFAKSKVESVHLKSGETLAAVEAFEAGDTENSSSVAFYFKTKDSEPWIFLDKLPQSWDSFSFRTDGAIKISAQEGDSSSSTTTSLWRLEKDHLKIIGQDSEVIQRYAIHSSTDPYRQKISTNFLTGQMTVVSEFAHAKTKKIECKFNKSSYENQKISDLTAEGGKTPECPDTKDLNPETRALNGDWKLTEIACLGKDLTERGRTQIQALKKDQLSVLLRLDNGIATYKVKFFEPKEPLMDCSVLRTEFWHLADEKLTVRDTVEKYTGKDTQKFKCSGANNITEAREHRLVISKANSKTMEIQLTGNIPGSSFETRNCESSVEKLIYSRSK